MNYNGQANFQGILSNEQVKPEGTLTISKVYDSGLTEVVFQDKNLITTLGKSILLNQLYYVGSGDPLSYAKVGSGGAIDSEGLFLKIPTLDLTDLYNPVATCGLVKTDENISVPSVTLLANLDNSVANGNKINEAGFFSVSGKLFNIKVFPGILKKSGFSLNFEWVIKML